MQTGKIEVIAAAYEGKPFQAPNDITIDSKGRLYFTDLAGVAVYRIDTSGAVARILAAPDVQRPNGIQVSPDDTEAVPDRSQSGAGRRAADPRLRSPARWDGAEHARPLRFFPGPQRRRHEHRYPGATCTRRPA
jgi:streptogramin lyase